MLRTDDKVYPKFSVTKYIDSKMYVTQKELIGGFHSIALARSLPRPTFLKTDRVASVDALRALAVKGAYRVSCEICVCSIGYCDLSILCPTPPYDTVYCQSCGLLPATTLVPFVSINWLTYLFNFFALLQAFL